MLIFRTPLTYIDQWAVASQQRARRNAMLQSTAFASVRAERIEVQEFLAAALAPPVEHARRRPNEVDSRGA